MITHGHSDHARAGHGAVLATQETLDLMRLRYGENFAGSTQAIRYGETLDARRHCGELSPGRPCARLGAGRGRGNGLRIVASGDYKDVADPTCAPFELVPCDVFITEATFGLPVFRHGDPDGEIAKLLRSVALFPERAHLVGAYSLGKAQRVIALIRQAGYDKPIYLHGAMEKITRYYESRGIALGELRAVRDAKKAELAGAIALCPPSALQGAMVAPFPRSGDALRIRLDARARARAPARRRAAAGDLRPRRLGRPHRDHRGDRRIRIWVTHGQEDALVHWCETRGLKARPLASWAMATKARATSRQHRARADRRGGA